MRKPLNVMNYELKSGRLIPKARMKTIPSAIRNDRLIVLLCGFKVVLQEMHFEHLTVLI